MGDIVLEGDNSCTLDKVKSCINSVISKVIYMNKDVDLSYKVEAFEESAGIYFEVVFDIIGTGWKYKTVGNDIAGKEDYISRKLVEIYEGCFLTRYNYDTMWIDGMLMWCLVEHRNGEYYLDDNNYPQLWSERGSL